MSLIEEIEVAANLRPLPTHAAMYKDQFALEITMSPWWARIKAALEHAQQIDKDLDVMIGDYRPGAMTKSQRNFREVMR